MELLSIEHLFGWYLTKLLGIVCIKTKIIDIKTKIP